MQRLLLLSPGSEGLKLGFDLQAAGADIGLVRDVAQTIALARQYAPSVLLLVADGSSDEGRVLMATLTMEPATAAMPLVVVTPTIDDALALAFLSTGVAAILPVDTPASEVLRVVAEVGGEAAGGPRAREAIDPSGPAVLRRIARYVLRHRCTLGVVLEGCPQGRAWVRWREGNFLDAQYGTRSGAEAVRALLGVPDATPWRVSLAEGEELTGAEIDLDDSIDLVVELDELDDAEAPPLAAVDVDSEAITGHELPTDAGLRVLVVDDDPDLLALYQRTFAQAGWRVQTAVDGEEGYTKALAQPPDLVVSDIMMPRTDGWGFLGRVRADYRLRETPFVLLSCHEDFLHKLKILDAGADDYLEKGLRPTAVVARVREVMAARLALKARVRPGQGFTGVLGRVGASFLLKLLAERQMTGQLRVTSRFGPIVVSHERGVITQARLVGADIEEHGSFALQTLLSLDDGPFVFSLAPPEPGTFNSPFDSVADTLTAELNLRNENQDTELLAHDKQLQCPRRELTDLYLATCSEPARPIAQRLVQGEAPLHVLASGVASPILIEAVVKDLLRKGVARFAG